MEDDFHPYYLRVGDSWTKIDYSRHGQGLDEALEGRQAGRSRGNPGELASR